MKIKKIVKQVVLVTEEQIIESFIGNEQEMDKKNIIVFALEESVNILSDYIYRC